MATASLPVDRVALTTPLVRYNGEEKHTNLRPLTTGKQIEPFVGANSHVSR